MKVTLRDIGSRAHEADLRARAGMVNVCVVGSRSLRDAAVVKRVLDRLGNVPLIADATSVQFICGCAQGADTLGQQWAEQHQYKTFLYPPDYEAYKGQPRHVAPFRRNIEMAKVTDIVIAFWDGKSRGTQHMLNTCADLNQFCAESPIVTKPIAPMAIYCSRTPRFGRWWSNINRKDKLS